MNQGTTLNFDYVRERSLNDFAHTHILYNTVFRSMSLISHSCVSVPVRWQLIRRVCHSLHASIILAHQKEPHTHGTRGGSLKLIAL